MISSMIKRKWKNGESTRRGEGARAARPIRLHVRGPVALRHRSRGIRESPRAEDVIAFPFPFLSSLLPPLPNRATPLSTPVPLPRALLLAASTDLPPSLSARIPLPQSHPPLPAADLPPAPGVGAHALPILAVGTAREALGSRRRRNQGRRIPQVDRSEVAHIAQAVLIKADSVDVIILCAI
ncbi:hypothetical protein ABZP36_018136 [Zizania latifolia]